MKMLPKGVKSFLYVFYFPLAFLFIGLTLNFLFVRMLPGDPVLAILAAQGISNPSQSVYEAMVRQLGFDQPLIIQFFRYLFEMFRGRWGISVSISRPEPVWDLIAQRLPRTLDLMLIPSILGIIVGVLLGTLIVRSKFRSLKLISRIFTLLMIAVPIFFFGMGLQFFFHQLIPDFPIFGYKDFTITDPPFVTGFYVIDAVIALEWYKIGDYLLHIILPASILFLLVTALTIRQIRANNENTSKDRDIFSTTLKIAMNFSWIMSAIILIETIFGRSGFSALIIEGINRQDYFVLQASLFILIIFFTIIIAFTNGFYRLYQRGVYERQWMPPKILSTSPKEIDPGSTREESGETSSIKQFVLDKIVHPFTIIGLLILGFAIIISIFPQLLTSYTIEEANGVLMGSWNPPSPNHPLGQCELGRDVLARVVYGISTSLTFGIFATLIAAGLGLLFGYISSLHKWAKNSILAVSVIGFILPAVILLMLIQSIGIGTVSIFPIIITGLLLMPIFTRIFTDQKSASWKSRDKLYELIIKLVIYIPLVLGIAILLIESLGFLGFSAGNPNETIQLGIDINNSRNHLIDAPWASFWPNLAIFSLVLGSFFLHYGLKEPRIVSKREVAIEEVPIDL